ncbi:MAG: hypothetical protein DI563_28040 [Variovorax paradoxus]|uniref:Uncharacterized protein n=1 Tax=Variovorax paradoxus TaxID=34073 RepID=A0A2W5PCN8_VARPD|nr:MAG: hypothetical protein DI563_28040 [Variovorax paradoxus]
MLAIRTVTFCTEIKRTPGLAARTTAGRRTTTREVQGIDQNVKLNRALWVLAEEMRSLKATA